MSESSRISKAWSSSAVWSAVLVLGTAVVAAVFWPCLTGGQCRGGGNIRGIALGVAGLVAIVASLAYSLRKDLPRFSIFPLEQWLFGHVVIGVLSLSLVVAHSGFHLENHVAALALLFLTLTVLSGVAGLFVFYFLPRKQARRETSLLVPDDLCRRLTLIHDEIARTCEGRGGAFQELYNELVVPLYLTRVGSEPPQADVTPWSERFDPEDADAFMNLAVQIEEAHDVLVLLGQHMRFRWWIRGWLLVHVPSTIGLMVFTVLHIVSITWYGVK